MNILNNRNKRTSIFKAVALCLIAAVSFTLVSCDDDMDIQQSYPFTVEVMPVPNKVTKGQTVEIRCELKKKGGNELWYLAPVRGKIPQLVTAPSNRLMPQPCEKIRKRHPSDSIYFRPFHARVS